MLLGAAGARQSTAAEDVESSSNKGEQKIAIKPIAYKEASQFREFLELVGVEYVVNPTLNTITLKGIPDRVNQAIKGIDTLDTPEQTIELTLYLVEASRTNTESISAPAGLHKAIEQLRGAFGFSGFRLLDSISLRVLSGRHGEITSSARLGDDPERNPNYKVSFDRVRLLPPDGDTVPVRIEDLRFELTGANGLYAGLRTDVEVAVGQMAVIGRSTARGLDGNLVLIINPELINGKS